MDINYFISDFANGETYVSITEFIDKFRPFDKLELFCKYTSFSFRKSRAEAKPIVIKKTYNNKSKIILSKGKIIRYIDTGDIPDIETLKKQKIIYTSKNNYTYYPLFPYANTVYEVKSILENIVGHGINENVLKLLFATSEGWNNDFSNNVLPEVMDEQNEKNKYEFKKMNYSELFC